MSKYTGSTGVVASVPPVSSSATPEHELGTRIETPDGRVYRYVGAGASALVVGNLIASQAEDTGEQALAVAATAIGSYTITTTSTPTVTANEYAGGFVCVTVTPGLGQTFRIKSHPAVTGAALTLTLEDPVQVALTTDSRIDLVPNLYDDVIQAPATVSGALLGVAVKAIAANEYGWILTRGPAAVLNQGDWTIGQVLVASDATDGAAEAGVDATDAQPYVGVALTGGTGGETNLVQVQIE